MKDAAPGDLAFTLAEAATPGLLVPALTETQLRHLVRGCRWQPSGWRHNGHGHPWATYPWADICELHAALVPFLR